MDLSGRDPNSGEISMSTINDIGIPLPGNTGMGILHPKVKNKFVVQFVNIGTIGSRDLSMQVITFNRPKITFQDIELHRYNSVAWYAGKHTFEALQLTVQDNYSNGATAIIQSQISLQQSLIGAQSGPYLASAPDAASYKFGIILQQLDGGTQVLEEWHYEGCFIASADYSEVDYSTADPLNIALTVRFDHAFQVFGNTPSSGQALGGSSPIIALS